MRLKIIVAAFAFAIPLLGCVPRNRSTEDVTPSYGVAAEQSYWDARRTNLEARRQDHSVIVVGIGDGAFRFLTFSFGQGYCTAEVHDERAADYFPIPARDFGAAFQLPPDDYYLHTKATETACRAEAENVVRLKAVLPFGSFQESVIKCQEKSALPCFFRWRLFRNVAARDIVHDPKLAISDGSGTGSATASSRAEAAALLRRLVAAPDSIVGPRYDLPGACQSIYYKLAVATICEMGLGSKAEYSLEAHQNVTY